MNNKYKNFLITQRIRFFYRIQPNPKVWIFSSAHNNKYNYNSKYLFEYVKSNLPEIKPYYVVNDDVLRRKLKERHGNEYFIETKSEEGIKKVLGAGVWFTAASMPVYGCNLKKSRLIVNLWHGVPLKKIVLMENHFPLIKKIYHRYIFARNYTHVLTTSSKLTQIMCKSFGVSQDIVKVWGQPRNDCLFKAGNDMERLQKVLPELPKYKKLILYAPTWRGGEKTRLFQFRDFDKQKLWDFLEKNKYVICIRTHIEESAIANEYLASRVMLLNDDKVEDIMEVIKVFDLLITDYSSIYIDYLLTGKPVMFLPYDMDEYFKDRGFNFPYKDITPGPKPADFKNLMEEFEKLLTDPNYYSVEREIINDYFNEIKEPCSAHICERILNEGNGK